MRNIILFLVVLLLLGGAALGGGYYWLTGVYATSAAPLTDTQLVNIPEGTGGQRIAQMLEEKEVISHAKLFRALAMLQKVNTRFQAGEYSFAAGITPQGVIEKLVSGDVIRHYITIPEGKTTIEIVEMIKAEPKLTGDILQMPPEGSLLPETYDFTRGSRKQELLSRMADAQRKVVIELWSLRQSNLPFATVEEALTLASIIEKETGKPEERTRVSAVYVNRLRKGMLLQADPTVAYGVYGGQYADKALTFKDLKTDTPYNTYMHTGLPPTPICNAGKASIAAALQPLVTEELYFVASGDGGHFFAQTLAEHNQNVTKYRKWKAGQQAAKKSVN